MKIVAICLPNFMPWIGYFEMGHRVDTFVMLDDVQYVKHEWVNRNKIISNSKAGWQWITVPVRKAPLKTFVNEVGISNETDWRDKLLKTIKQYYSKAPNFDEYFSLFESILSQKWRKLSDLNLSLIRLIYDILGINKNILPSSRLKTIEGREEKLLDICSKLKADVYLANNGSMSYIDPNVFHEAGIGFVFQDYEHPTYRVDQREFVPYLSVIDLIFWHGKNAMDVILSGRKKNWKEGITYGEVKVK